MVRARVFFEAEAEANAEAEAGAWARANAEEHLRAELIEIFDEELDEDPAVLAGGELEDSLEDF